jgi:hypothetical protein
MAAPGLFAAAVALAGAYVVLSLGSLIATVTGFEACSGLRAHRFVTEALTPRIEAVVLMSEAATTALLWIGLYDARNNAAVLVLVVAGYAGLLAWLVGFSLKSRIIADATRKQGLFATWAVFALSFIAAAVVLSSERGAPVRAQVFLWLHAAHRFLLDGLAYTFKMIAVPAAGPPASSSYL